MSEIRSSFISMRICVSPESRGGRRSVWVSESRRGYRSGRLPQRSARRKEKRWIAWLIGFAHGSLRLVENRFSGRDGWAPAGMQAGSSRSRSTNSPGASHRSNGWMMKKNARCFSRISAHGLSLGRRCRHSVMPPVRGCRATSALERLACCISEWSSRPPSWSPRAAWLATHRKLPSFLWLRALGWMRCSGRGGQSFRSISRRREVAWGQWVRRHRKFPVSGCGRRAAP